MATTNPSPAPAKPLPKEIKQDTISLPHKPTAQIHYTFASPSSPSQPPTTLLVFLNGLMTDSTTWLPTISSLITNSPTTFPAILAYDRYGQGQTPSRDPLDSLPGREESHGHDCADAAEDLHQLITLIISKPRFPSNSPNPPRIILTANSIGCAIARLYAATHPTAALLLLDSVLANSTFDLLPNPDSPSFSPQQTEPAVPSTITIPTLREQRAKILAIFAPAVPNREGLCRRNLASLLPESDGPRLLGEPFVTVVGHDPETFAEDSWRSMGMRRELTMAFTQPVWEGYNHGLARLTRRERSKGPIVARGCGHFVQRDGPAFVVQELEELVAKVRGEGKQV